MSARDRTADRDGAPANAFDPAREPDLFEGVLSRRFVAFLIDAVVIFLLSLAGYLLIGILGILTLGLGFLLIGLVFPVVALAYTGMTLSAPASATIGMRMMGLQMRLWHGERMYFLIGVFHALVFWVSVSLLTPLILLVALFNRRKRLLHDFISGAVVINSLD